MSKICASLHEAGAQIRSKLDEPRLNSSEAWANDETPEPSMQRDLAPNLTNPSHAQTKAETPTNMCKPGRSQRDKSSALPDSCIGPYCRAGHRLSMVVPFPVTTCLWKVQPPEGPEETFYPHPCQHNESPTKSSGKPWSSEGSIPETNEKSTIWF